MEQVYVPHNPHEKAMQRALIQYRNPKNYELVKEALIKAGRTDLIGFDKKCLIRPRETHWGGNGVFVGNGARGGKRGSWWYWKENGWKRQRCVSECGQACGSRKNRNSETGKEKDNPECS